MTKVTLHAPKHRTALHVGEHELAVVDGRVDVPAEHVEEAKAFGFSEHPIAEEVQAKHSDRLDALEARIAALEEALPKKKGA